MTRKSPEASPDTQPPQLFPTDFEAPVENPDPTLNKTTQRRYQAAASRSQSLLFPQSLDEYVSKNNAVRAIDAWVDTLDLQQLGFVTAQPGRSTGQPAYDPAMLLKLYLYGYQQGIRSSRKLERESRRNVELMWLCRHNTPSYKTIANFRKDNVKALKQAHAAFLQLCRELRLLGEKMVAVDGSFVKANARLSSMHTEKHLAEVVKKLEKRIEHYHQQLDEADVEEDAGGDAGDLEDPQLADKLAKLAERLAEKQVLQQQLTESGDKQVSTVDVDARAMTKRGHTVGGYNAQIAVDDEHKLIVAEDVVQDVTDKNQLSAMLSKAQDAMGCEDLTGLADAGYYNGEELKACEEQGQTVYVPVPNTVDKGTKSGRFARRDFDYDKDRDVYLCPNGKELTGTGKQRRVNRKLYDLYQSEVADCDGCALRTQCLPQKHRRRTLQRWQHEAVVDRHKKRMTAADARPLMRRRGALAEHPFGTLKRWCGLDHFLMRGLDKCRGEFSLLVLGYNFKRVLNLIGIQAFRDYCLQNPGNSVYRV